MLEKARARPETERQLRQARRVEANASTAMRRRFLDMTPQAVAALAVRGTSREHTPRTTTSTTRRASSASKSRTGPRQPGPDDGDPETAEIELLARCRREVDRAFDAWQKAVARTEPLFVAPIEDVA
jgi:hypothetical protein